MSLEAALEFMSKVRQDEGLYENLKTVQKGDLDAFLRVAASAGFTFGLDEWRGAVARAKGELGDGDLESVSGGAGVTLSFAKVQIPPVLRNIASAMCGASCGSGCGGDLDTEALGAAKFRVR
jgi:predicted ribosomally synthesized peptide with nif11-like leader